MSFTPVAFTWTGREFHPTAPVDSPDILVADSWRVHRGQTWGLQDHLSRFVRGIAVQHTINGPMPRIDLVAFGAAITHQLTKIAQQYSDTDLFPRVSVEAHRDGYRVVLLVRPAPPVRTTTTLLIPDYTDPRTSPTVKGPDIRLMRGLVTAATTDDVVLHDGTDVIETTTGAVLLWSAPRQLVLCQASEQLASISAQRIARQATSRNISVITRPVGIDEFATGKYPVWCTNTLHGISPVISVSDGHRTTMLASHPETATWHSAWWRRFAP